MPKLLFITTSSLATNPRLVKEFEALKKNYQCSVISFKHEDWSASLSEAIITRNPEVTFHQIDRKQTVFDTLVSKLVHRMAIVLNPYFKYHLRIAAYASTDKSFQLLRVIKRLYAVNKVDLVIAHNLGAFYPAHQFADGKIRFQLDIEDYHLGELPYFNKAYETKNRELLMRTLLPKAFQVTYAAPLIMAECLKLCAKSPQLAAKSTVINNCFSQQEFQFEASASGKVKLVWFSQNIAKGRGLEALLPALSEFSDQLELHLIGHLYPDFEKAYISPYRSFIHIHPPQSQQALNLGLANFDVGLALEVKSDDFNRQLCLTNKIWAYLQSGLFIFASDTLAQQEFMVTHHKSGIIAAADTELMRKSLVELLTTIDRIRAEKAVRFAYAKSYAWEHEQDKLKDLVT